MDGIPEKNPGCIYKPNPKDITDPCKIHDKFLQTIFGFLLNPWESLRWLISKIDKIVFGKPTGLSSSNYWKISSGTFERITGVIVVEFCDPKPIMNYYIDECIENLL